MVNGLERQVGEDVSDSSDEDTNKDYLDIPDEEINHIELRIPAGRETTQPKRSRGRPKKSVNDVKNHSIKKKSCFKQKSN
ncbi:hypothetical protein BpHYR1_037161 [Brachionus plicatilis]|uniref:Uncharacterized protein n=1 Tax=Brachionus plicatilis TaxID=10195 RepID=A0A3M7RES6_BRAPC|nr:hypothetical protein BpHYR1_037161 [Brachionus plicatilis]